MAVSQFTIYRSTDGSAPVLTGAVGSLVALLDACLVNGYGAKAAAGWTKPFIGTNKAAFKQGTGSTGFYLRVQDDAGGTGGAKEALIRGGEVMSDVDTFTTNPFPSNAQSALTSNSLVARKSATADATARAWTVVADGRTVYVFVYTGDTANVYIGFMFGEIYSFLTGDNYRCALMGRTSENSAATTSEGLTLWSVITAAAGGNFLARSYTAVGTSAGAGKHGDYAAMVAWFGSISFPSQAGYSTYPNPIDSSIYLSPIWVTEPLAGVGGLRGRMRGFWHWILNPAAVADGDTFSGSGDLAGKTFLILKNGQAGNVGAGNAGCIFVIETSNTVETN